MKKIFYGCALALGGITMPLVAQDCCYPPQTNSNCCEENGFNGFYIGGNVGALSHTAHRNDLDGFLTDNSGWTTIDTNVTAGVQLGYDWQDCNRLLGLVADWNWANTDKTLRDNPSVVGENLIRSEFDWFSTIRARAGLAATNTLVYITFGAAVASFKTTWADDLIEFHHDNTRWGWTGGAGVEFLVWCNWSVGLEILHLQFTHEEESFTGDDEDFRFAHSDSSWVGRLAINYRFGNLF